MTPLDTASWSYLLAHPGVIRITFLRPVVLLLTAAVPLFFLLRHRAGRWPARLRAVALLAVIAVLAGVRLTAPLPRSPLAVIVAIDRSDSIDQAGQEWSRQYVDEVMKALAPGDEIGVLTFATDARVAASPGPPAPLREWPPLASRSATDISRAIQTGVALFPPDTDRRLLLITDGHETRGDSRAELARLREASVRVDVAIPPRSQAPDVRVDQLAVAPLVVEDQLFPLRVVARNSGKPGPALLNVFLDDAIVNSTGVDLLPGLNAFDLPHRVTGQGSHRLRAALDAPGDSFAGNNDREVPIMVTGAPRVLLVTRREHSVLSGVFERRGLAVEQRPPDRLPQSAADLLRYHGVLLEDLTATQVSSSAIEALNQYVHDLGGGVIVVGGAATFGDERFKNTALRRMLPVTLEPKRPSRTQREPLGLFLVIDRSNSMGYNSRIGTLRDGEKLRFAEEAALAVVRQLKDRDLVGVIAFDSRPWDISPLRPLKENRAQLEQDIPRLTENGGTDFYDALVSARRQLAQSRVNRRHIILLTDGDTNRADLADYDRLIDEFRQAHISITTIRIGDDTVNLKLLQGISERTGGEFHHVADAQMLPELMLRDTTRALEPLGSSTDQFFPHVGARNQSLRGIPSKDLPPLTGYAYTRPKPGAEVVIHVARPDRADPILTVWQYGLGRVAAFSASLSDDAEPWLGWPDFSKLWSQLARWTLREQVPSDYLLDLRRADGTVELIVHTFDPAAIDGVLLARFSPPEAAAREVSLVPRGPREFAARVPGLPPGRYPLTIIKRDNRGNLSERTTPVTVPALDDETQEEQPRHEPNLPLLTQLAEQTGGSINPDVRELVQRQPGTRLVFYPLDHLLIPLAMLLFLADVALRQFSTQRP